MSKHSTTCGLALRGPEPPQLPLAASEAQVLKSRASISSGPDISLPSEALKTKAQGLSKERVKGTRLCSVH